MRLRMLSKYTYLNAIDYIIISRYICIWFRYLFHEIM